MSSADLVRLLGGGGRVQAAEWKQARVGADGVRVDWAVLQP
jgi:hypothetical protein